ncbi:hypothetical protein ACWE42_21615 [Sutcliffiella cohnii]
MLTVRQDILQKWKTEIEHELNRFYGKIDKAYNEIEQLQIRILWMSFVMICKDETAMLMVTCLCCRKI